MNITYFKPAGADYIRVFMDRQLTGHIMLYTMLEGFRYCPTYGESGPCFPTVDEVKRSIEGED